MPESPDNRGPGEIQDGRDFDLHGIVGIRLIDPAHADVDAVRRQLGPIDVPLGRAPDIVVRFVDPRSEAPKIGGGDVRLYRWGNLAICQPHVKPYPVFHVHASQGGSSARPPFVEATINVGGDYDS